MSRQQEDFGKTNKRGWGVTNGEELKELLKATAVHLSYTEEEELYADDDADCCGPNDYYW